MSDLIGDGSGMENPGNGSDGAPERDNTPDEDESGTDSDSGNTNVPGAGSFDREGPPPGDPGFSGPNNNCRREVPALPFRGRRARP